ncbi:hypothetical protein BD289DRAFT_15956 [Coniella lustricola]|uniref:Uncharacterized protein n=1 Tax=Coniella lustricola TaxID=2025994 RepID=A0A2T3A3V8_9PEZI|nr:hypothetical protein BD289DRAFT_15956 [Coniella lustricola]
MDICTATAVHFVLVEQPYMTLSSICGWFGMAFNCICHGDTSLVLFPDRAREMLCTASMRKTLPGSSARLGIPAMPVLSLSPVSTLLRRHTAFCLGRVARVGRFENRPEEARDATNTNRLSMMAKQSGTRGCTGAQSREPSADLNIALPTAARHRHVAIAGWCRDRGRSSGA